MEEYDKYTPVNSKDEEKFLRYKETIPQTISMLAKAIETLGVSKDVVGEGVINFTDQRLHLTIVGRSDLEYSQQVFIDAASSHSSQRRSFRLVGNQDQLGSIRKVKKRWFTFFLSPKVPLTPNRNHLIQVAFYKKCKPNHDARLVYVTKDDFKIFDKNNCQDLTDENLENYYEELVRTCLRRERLVLKYNDLTDKEKFITEIVKDLDPQFDHPFLWSIGDQFVKQAKELWSSNGGNK